MEETQGLQDYSDNQPVRSIDPVCGSLINQDLAAAKTAYWGQMYYFCSTDCQNRFEENPEHYVSRLRA